MCPVSTQLQSVEAPKHQSKVEAGYARDGVILKDSFMNGIANMGLWRNSINADTT